MNIRPAAQTELKEIERLLSENSLPVEDINDGKIQFFVGENDCEIFGVIGLEKYNELGLLRSLAVKNSYKGKKLGLSLVDYLFMFSNKRQIKELYLLTDTAVEYFQKIGFREVDREMVPKAIQQTTEFSKLCPDDAVIMTKAIH
jgi:amino-acid N-acetyltransferase